MTASSTRDTGVSLRFDDGGPQPFSTIRVHSAEYIDEINEPYSLTLGITSTDPSVDPREVVGRDVTVVFEGEPWLGEIRGLVGACRQRSAMGLAGELSAYEVSVAPPLWLLARRFARRIHQNKAANDIITATLAAAGAAPPMSRVGRTLAVPEYTAQYDETDLQFVRRLLSENHLVAFFDHTHGGVLTITDSIASAASVVPTPLVFRPETGLVSDAPHVVGIGSVLALDVTRVSLRDYDFEHPLLARARPYGLEGNATVPRAETLPHEVGSHEELRVGRFSAEREAGELAERDLVARRGPSHALSWAPSFAMHTGSRFTLRDHPRADLGEDFVVIGSRIRIDDGTAFEGDAPRKPGRRYLCRCVPAATPHYARPVERPRLPGAESAFVVGDGTEGSVDVDEFGRVKLELPWDRRDLRGGNPTRWVRVSQGWAGANRGMVTLPRIGDEVLVAYLGGDPDEPVVVGRVHNALARTPLDLPDPDRTVSLWRSRTIGGDGYNEILMDDAPGKERLWLRAEREHRLQVNQGSTVNVDGDAAVTVGGDASVRVANDLKVRSASYEQETGPLEIRSTTSKQVARDELSLESDTIRLEASSKIELRCGGVSLVLTPGGATLTGGKVTITGGNIHLKADGVVDVDGALITLN